VGHDVTLSDDELIRLARELAAARSWTWLEPVRVRRFREGFFGPRRWEVLSNVGSRGCNVRVVFDAESGAVVGSSFLPR
jgi:hypothetical protein